MNIKQIFLLTCMVVTFSAQKVLSMETVQSEIDEQLIKACVDGNSVKVKEVLKFGANVNTRYTSQTMSCDAVTPLMIAGRKLDIKTCKILLENNANIASQDSRGYTVLHFISRQAKSDWEGDNFYYPQKFLKVRKIKKVAQLVIDQQKLRNKKIVCILLCLKKLKDKRNLVGNILYTNREVLLYPYIRQEIQNYFPLNRLLKLKSKYGYCAYDMSSDVERKDRPIEFLNPEN